jgi:hypothetical protein
MDNFNEYLKGSSFTLYRDVTTEATLGTTQLKTLNRLKNTMIEHDFQTRDRQKANLPPNLKTGQITNESKPDSTFNDVIHVDLIKTDSVGSAILSITDHTRTLTRLAVLTDDKIDSVATSIWHQWCLPYGNPTTIKSNTGKVWTSKLENRLSKLNQDGPKIICRSEKETFFPEIQQQWRQQQLNTSATDFTQDWNFLGRLQAPNDANLDLDDLDQADSDLDDIEDFVEADTNQNGLTLNQPETQDLQKEWLQLIQAEKEIEMLKNRLRKAETGYQREMELEDLLVDEADEELGHLEDEDLEWVKSIFNSSPSQNCHRQNSDQRKLKSITEVDAQKRAHTVPAPPIKFNQNFNHNSMTPSAGEDDFSFHSDADYEGDCELGDYFSDDEEENNQITELGNYFSDDEEDNTQSQPSSHSEDNFWSHTQVPNLKEKLKLPQTAFSNWNPIISSLKAFEVKEETQIKKIAGFREENQLGLSAWPPFTPLAPAFQNSAAHSQLSAFSSQAFLSREPTRIQISTISTSTKLKKKRTAPHRATSQWPPKHWHLSKPPTRKSTTKRTRPWRESKGACEGSRSWQKRCPDPLGQSNSVKHCTEQPLYSVITNQNQNTSCQNMPPVKGNDGDETSDPEPTTLQQPVRRQKQKRPPNGSYKTWPPHYFRSRVLPQSEQPYTWQQVSDVPNVHPASTPLKLRTFWITKPARSIARTKYWGKRLLKSYIRTPTSPTKSPPITRRRRKNSKRTQLWHWSQKPFPPICSLSTAKTPRSYTIKKTCPHGGSHFSKRRSESTSYRQQSENYDQCQGDNSKNDTQSETDDITVKSKENLKTMTKIDEAKIIARDDEVKAIGKTAEEFRASIEKQIDRGIETKALITLPHPSATISYIPILTFTSFICIFSILNSFVADPLDHHFQTFTIGDLSDCKLRHLSRQTASTQADTVVKTLANPDSIRPFKIPGTWPDVHYKSRSRNPLVPSHLLSGRVRKSETKFHHDSFIFDYLDSSR